MHSMDRQQVIPGQSAAHHRLSRTWRVRTGHRVVFSGFRPDPVKYLHSADVAVLKARIVPRARPAVIDLGGVDKFEPISGGSDMDHAEEAVGELIVSGGDGAVDLELPEHAFDAIALFVERPIVFDLHAAV